MPDHVLAAGNQVELISGFCYLGSHVEADGISGPEVCQHVAIARACMSSLQRGIWKSCICLDTKLSLFQAYILRVLQYGSETWTLTRALESGDKAGCIPTLEPQADLHVPFSAHIPNAEIYNQAGKVPVSEMVQGRRFQLFGYVARCGVEQDHVRALRAMIRDPPRGRRRPVDHPRQTWLRGILAHLLPLNIGPN